MTINEARKIMIDYYDNTNPSEGDSFMFVEALEYLIEETKDPKYMMHLGEYYYGLRRFYLALKYYEMAAEYDIIPAIASLGYIWYYGRTGTRDYEKAFKYYSRAAKAGELQSSYKLADMYKNGYYVEKDYGKYKDIIEDLCEKIDSGRYSDYYIPDLYTRLAGIRRKEGDDKEALRLFDIARVSLSDRIQWSRFFGDLSIMKRLINEIYELRPFDTEDFGLYDLYYLFKTPVKVRFWFEEEQYEAEAAEEDGGMAVRFGDKWFRTIDIFFEKAEIDGELLTSRYEELYDFEVI